MFEYRLCFTKLNNLKYLSHLNLMKTMERAIRRAGIPLAFSEGFHPHPKISFGPALALGIDSMAEYLDLELVAAMEAGLILDSLNRVLPDGLRISEAKRLGPGAKSLNALINKAAYRVLLQIEPDLKEAVKQQLSRLFQMTELNIFRTGKEGQKTVNIRPWMHNLTIEEKSDTMLAVYLVGEIGNNGNLRPEEVLDRITLPLKVVALTRNGLWYEEKGLVKTPMDFGEQIGDMDHD